MFSIVLDESFDIINDEAPFSVFIKPMKVNNDQNLKDFSAHGYKGILNVKKHSYEENIKYFQELQIDRKEPVIYLYDPFFSNADELSKLRNWLMPERNIFPVPLSQNRAELFFLLSCLSKWPDKVLPTYQNVYKYIQFYRNNYIGFIVAPKLKAFYDKKTISSIHKTPKENVFKMTWSTDDYKKRSKKQGTIGSLLENEYSLSHENKAIWVVRKGTQFQISGVNHYYDIDTKSLPINMPFIHAILLDTKQ